MWSAALDLQLLCSSAILYNITAFRITTILISTYLKHIYLRSTALGPDGEPIGGGSVGGTPLKQFTPPRMGSANAVRNATNKNGLELVQQSQHPRTNGNSKQPCSLAVAGNAPCT